MGNKLFKFLNPEVNSGLGRLGIPRLIFVQHTKYKSTRPRCFNKDEIDWKRPESMEISSRRTKTQFFELEPKSRRTAPNMG